nr:hypothetical protein [Cohnella sp. LGH]
MKSTTAIGKIKTEFSLQNATSFGGVKIFLAFLEKIKLADAMRGLSAAKRVTRSFPFTVSCSISSSVGCSAVNGFSIFVVCMATRY